jgi:DNA-directed RNA polymerase specialized sigma24 family protein
MLASPQTVADALTLYYPRLLAYCRALMHDAEKGADLAHDAIVDTLSTHLDTPPSWAWLKQRTYYSYLTQRRQGAVRAKRLETAWHRVWWKWPQPMPDPEDAAVQTDSVARALAVVARLNPNQRRAVLAPPSARKGAVGMAALRGRAKLRSLLTKEYAAT